MFCISILVLAVAVLAGSLPAQTNDFEVHIATENSPGTGYWRIIDVTLHKGDRDFNGFDLLISYPAEAMSLDTVTPGYFTDSCGWEYFDYRPGLQHIPCDSACPEGLVRVVSLADMNNGAPEPSCLSTDTLPVTLFRLRFLLSNDRKWECAKLPIRFYWYDCTDNLLYYHHSGGPSHDDRFLSREVYDSFTGHPLTWPLFDIGRIYGAPLSCAGDSAQRLVDFYDGGILVGGYCGPPWEIDGRGDLNLNGWSYEVADATLYADYFLHGLSVFILPLSQTAASDANKDGIPLTLADFAYMWRVINGEVPSWYQVPPPRPSTTVYGNHNSILTITESRPLAALNLTLRGQVEPELLVEHATMETAYDAADDLTRVLIFEPDPGYAMNTGELLDLRGHGLLNIDAATADAGPVELQFLGTSNGLITVEQNYPNPFVLSSSPTTDIFAVSITPGVGKLDIFNTLGQKVYSTRVEFLSAGTTMIRWPGTDMSGSRVAPGVYFYRLSFNGSAVTKKMLLLK